MRNCVHFREKWQLVFQRRAVGFVYKADKNSEATKKAMEFPLIVFRQYLKERELDEDQLVLSKAKLRSRLH